MAVEALAQRAPFGGGLSVSGLYWFKFYSQEWLGSPSVRMCSLAALGLWTQIQCYCAQAEPRGYLVVNGEALDARRLALVTGRHPGEVKRLLAELETKGMLSVEDGRIFSAWIVADTERSQAGRRNGRKGGNPVLLGCAEGEGVNPTVNPRVNPSVNPGTCRGDNPKNQETKNRKYKGEAGDRSNESRTVLPSWGGPPELRRRVVAETSEAFGRGCLDPSTWVEAEQRIIPRTEWAADQFRSIEALLEQLGVSVGPPVRAGAVRDEPPR